MKYECPTCNEIDHDIDALRARLADVEAERDRWTESARWFCENSIYWQGRVEAAEARLAAVEALCDELAGDIEYSRVHGDGPAEYRDGWQHGVEFAADRVRAATCGEGDR